MNDNHSPPPRMFEKIPDAPQNQIAQLFAIARGKVGKEGDQKRRLAEAEIIVKEAQGYSSKYGCRDNRPINVIRAWKKYKSEKEKAKRNSNKPVHPELSGSIKSFFEIAVRSGFHNTEMLEKLLDEDRKSFYRIARLAKKIDTHDAKYIEERRRQRAERKAIASHACMPRAVNA